MSRVIIIVDMEGAAGIGNLKESFPWYPEYHKHGVIQLAGDVNATVRGLRAGGIEDIVVCVIHLFDHNPLENRLDSSVKLVRGSLRNMEKFLDEGCEGGVLLGYHAMAGTPNGFLSHTLSPFLRVRVNGQPVGEIALFSWLCGAYDVPTAMVTGDDIGVKEAKDFLPSVSTVAVKKSKNRAVTECFPTEEVRRIIEETATTAAQQLNKCKVYRAKEPVLMEIALRKTIDADVVAYIPGVKKTSPRVVAYESKKYLAAFEFLWTVVNLAECILVSEVMQKLTATDEGKKIFGEWNRQFAEQWLQEPQELWYE